MNGATTHPWAIKWRRKDDVMTCYLAPRSENEQSAKWVPLVTVLNAALDVDPNDKLNRDESIYTELGEAIQKWYLRCASSYEHDVSKWPNQVIATCAEGKTS